MALTQGTRLGPYEVRSLLGAGGMGEVYRACDTRLDREVAIKVLPAHLTSSAEFKQRFEREAKSISQLTHPHICTLHDVGHHEGADYLVMELLEGESLAQRLSKGPLPLDQVLRIGMEVAAALDKAHRSGVVHRDLKPGNIMLTKTGAKLLDFGLAKSVSLGDSTGMTVTQPLTSAGALVGTFQYMSPEQLEGKEADGRTDLFALGAVLYEMSTGQRAFEGSSRASLIASIMSAQPRAIGDLQPMTPPALDRLIRKCLAKDPDARWQSASDVADELRWIAEGGSQAKAPLPNHWKRNLRKVTWITCLVIVLLTFVIHSRPTVKPSESHSRRVWTSIPAPAHAEPVAWGDLAGPVVISPDGTMVAFVAGNANERQLWIRPLSVNAARALDGTEGASFPFWSADSKSLGYFAHEKLWTISVAGGPGVSICEAVGGRGGAWNRDGVILFSPTYRSPLFRVAATGGTPEQVTKIDESKHTSHRWPAFCADGKHFVYLGVAHGAAAAEANASFLGSLDGGEPKLLLRGSANVVPVGDYVLIQRDNTLLAGRFDLNSAKIIGEPAVVATGVLYDVSVWRAGFSVSEHGELAFHSGTSTGEFRPTRRDRTGKELGAIGDPVNLWSIRLSPDGKKLAVAVAGWVSDIWIYDVARGTRTRLTFGGRGSRVEPVWSADGQWVIYSTLALGDLQVDANRISRRPAIGGDEEVLYTSKDEVWVLDSSFDGKHLLLGKGKYIGESPCDIWVLPLDGEKKAYPLIQTSFLDCHAVFSPDGRWVAYDSNETGVREVYIIPFHSRIEDTSTAPEAIHGGRWRVSTRGGSWPRWSRNGKELFYVSMLGSEVMTTEIVSTANDIAFGRTTSLFSIIQSAGIVPYDVSAEGDWFVDAAGIAKTCAPINVILNWDAELIAGTRE